jgi:hypothetical protein
MCDFGFSIGEIEGLTIVDLRFTIGEKGIDDWRRAVTPRLRTPDLGLRTSHTGFVVLEFCIPAP